ncbi:hypothetical protein [Alkaliphilus peptidifermentans]|uniref:Uncharacterized protein n=1 Tax=Alkaliphilus peptidifermentans DSM 18978 TaxID=1120976 RepID=A0A1G5LC22_9FIRM|nr:hypothetical protein [Alkaliphilus peptidifermentans]SCZ10422.1 hypothetical protein SAMN03080606_04281 [Alkaliphilus peptidifermentans DSM 18978]
MALVKKQASEEEMKMGKSVMASNREVKDNVISLKPQKTTETIENLNNVNFWGVGFKKDHLIW